MALTKEQLKMLSGALKDLENSLTDGLEKLNNDFEMLTVKSVEDLKEINRLVKKLK